LVGSSKENDRIRWARMMAASCNEKNAPIQTRGPAPKDGGGPGVRLRKAKKKTK
jgi:hypothetical protein